MKPIKLKLTPYPENKLILAGYPRYLPTWFKICSLRILVDKALERIQTFIWTPLIPYFKANLSLFGVSKNMQFWVLKKQDTRQKYLFQGMIDTQLNCMTLIEINSSKLFNIYLTAVIMFFDRRSILDATYEA